MKDLHLIAHKVRGEQAFDIAVLIEEGTESDPGPWWITSVGHRAWPYWCHPLSLVLLEDVEAIVPLSWPKMPASWPDYISKQKKPEPKPVRIRQPINLEELGL
jgi:hypothetical protein